MRFLKQKKAAFEVALKESMASLGEKDDLRDACEYALTNGGKRYRPIITEMVAEALGSQPPLEAMLAIEYFHTASLIVDDLPCMDDEAFRRDKPVLHHVFDESIAILASYALIAAGYSHLYRGGRNLNHTAALEAFEIASRCSGAQGATGGQFLDLFPKGHALSDLKEVIYKKTVTLFEGAFAFGWIFGGGPIEKLSEVAACAYHFGMAFQIADDFLDFEEDMESQAKMNIAICLGREEAEECFLEEISGFTAKLSALGINTERFQELQALLTRRFQAACCK